MRMFKACNKQKLKCKVYLIGGKNNGDLKASSEKINEACDE